MKFDLVIVGAGWAGLTAASELRERGIEALVLEKARGPGGRSATRRHGAARFDHGAQYFTARTGAFARQLQQWRDAGLAAPWRPRLKTFGGLAGHTDPDATARYVMTPAMNAWCKAAAGALDVRFQTRVERLAFDGSWKLELDDGEELESQRLLVTAPAPQTVQLLGRGDRLVAMLEPVQFNPCLSAMLTLEDGFDPGFDAAFVNTGSALAWVARNSSKPGRAGEDWVLHATSDWSRLHLEADFDALADRLGTAFAELVGLDSLPVVAATGHRWRYAQAIEPRAEGILTDADRRLAIAGDWLAGNRVEGAWLSGRKAADWLAGTD